MLKQQIVPILGLSEPISSLSHLITAVIFLIVGLKIIFDSRGNTLRVSGISLYVFCAVFLFSMSGVYHLLENGSLGNFVLQILDHSGIYLMISGSFTPFQIILLRGYKRWLTLILIWILAVTGLTLTAIYFEEMPEWLILSFFIGMGWMSLLTVWFVKDIHIATVKIIFLGGIIYTLGALIDFLRWPNPIEGVIHAHEIFHLFVSAAALVHLYGIYTLSQIPISSRLVLIVKYYPNFIWAKFTTENIIFKSYTKEEIFNDIEAWIKKEFPEKLKPKNIKVKYYREDFYHLNE
ncbi:PAQR family membrane homeostasis protein TrhA [Alteromonas gilva]|uniref:Hemolysin III family protein n=1 Tax=Alteromonas gilva TaxID=2987522 RepID=A0ABT5KZH0_9ALTE|nr:hemolysin III family protein [Alteromonas gilva]MDC8830155.1 hemolysin III family protein [Alteromonas gilva]